MSVLWLALVVLVLAVPLTWYIDRTFARYEREAEMRRLFAPHARALAELKQAISVAFAPVMQQAVKAMADMEASMAKVNEAMRESEGLAGLRRLADQMSKGDDR